MRRTASAADRHVNARFVGLTAATGAFLTFGLAPLAAAPAAHADFDEALDIAFAPFVDAATSTLDWDAVLSPSAWDTFLAPEHWDSVLTELAGTALAGGKLVANGGRVLNVTASGKNVTEAQANAYAAVDLVDFADGFCRRDIGWREVDREKQGHEDHDR